MGRPPNSEARDTRQALLDAGLELFAEKGFFGTSLREIARAVGVRESAVYHHFESKEALFAAIVGESVPPPALAWDDGPLPPTSELLERLALSILGRFAMLRERKLYRIMLSDGVRLAEQGHIDAFQRMSANSERLVRLMERLVKEKRLRAAPPEWLALGFFGPLLVWRQLLELQPRHSAVTDARGFVRAHVANFLQGAATVPKH